MQIILSVLLQTSTGLLINVFICPLNADSTIIICQRVLCVLCALLLVFFFFEKLIILLHFQKKGQKNCSKKKLCIIFCIAEENSLKILLFYIDIVIYTYSRRIQVHKKKILPKYIH